MRNDVINKITDLAGVDNRIILMVGDLGYNVVEEFKVNFPERFINVGIAEQKMNAWAAGLALSRNVAFTYSIGNFATLRGIEQIRNDICYHHANVKILAVGCGFAYGDLGMTHHATEDISIMRSLPYMRVYTPADAKEALFCLEDAYKHEGPAYIRMARGKEPDLHLNISENEIQDFIGIHPFSEMVNILCCGTILVEGYKLRELLEKNGIKTGLYSVPVVNPLDKKSVIEISKKSKLIVTMEDHNIIGGFGGAVAEAISVIQDRHSTLLRIGLDGVFTEIVGDQDYLRNYYGMSAEKVLPKVMSIVGRSDQ